jgi:hypothetical protein
VDLLPTRSMVGRLPRIGRAAATLRHLVMEFTE